jgi:hypothetical protein
MDDAEHGASIIGAMVVQDDPSRDRGRVLQENCAGARTDSCRTCRRASSVASGCGSADAGGELLLHELGTQTATHAARPTMA